MKRMIVSLFCSTAFILAIGSTAAYAQSNSYSADIPFDFNVRGTHYTAGRYSLVPASNVTGWGAIIMISRDTGKAKFVGLNNGGSQAATENAKLVFARNGDRYSLAEISTPTMGMRFKRTETRVQELTKNEKPAVVVVALHE